jgi:hypothetical protein
MKMAFHLSLICIVSFHIRRSDFWLLAKSYARRFEDRYRKIRQEFDVGEDDEEAAAEEKDDGESGSRKSTGGGSATKTPKGSASSSSNLSDTNKSSASSPGAAPKPSLDARAQFGSNLFLLSGVELGYVISTCEEECPKALEYVPGGVPDSHIEINVDLIPTKTFDMLNTYVQSKVGGGTGGGSASKAKSNGSRSGSPNSDKKGPGRPKKKQKKE